MQKNGYVTSIIAAGQHVESGKTIARMLEGYPYAKLKPPLKTVQSMAQVLAQSDILLMPSVFAEPFGMLSVEAQHAGRSEEHTSELQSLMRISYAVFCLK